MKVHIVRMNKSVVHGIIDGKYDWITAKAVAIGDIVLAKLDGELIAFEVKARQWSWSVSLKLLEIEK